MAKNSKSLGAWGETKALAGNWGKSKADLILGQFGMTDLIKAEDYKGKTGNMYATGTDKIGQVQGTVGKAIGNVLLPGSGAIGSQLNEQAKGMRPPTPEPQKVPQPDYMKQKTATTYTKYEHGGDMEDEEEGMSMEHGMGNHVMVNVEKGELEVNPKTGEIVKHFNNVPKHPKGKDIINMKGNVHVSKESVIIPAKVSNKYVSASKEERMKIIADVVKKADAIEDKGEGEMEGKMAVGGTPGSLGYDTPTKAPGSFGYDTTTKTYDPSNPLGLGSTNLSQDYGISNTTPTNKTTSEPSDSYSLGAGVAALPALALGGYQTLQSKKALEDLAKKPLPQYGVTPEQLASQKRATESFGRAQELAKRGFTPAEQAAYQQNLARANATTLYNARNTAGGQMGGVMGATLGSQNLNALLDYAAKDAALNRQNISYADRMGQYLGQVQGDITQQKNRATATDIQRRQQIEQALGTARSQGQVNLANAGGQILGSAVTNNPNLFA